MIKWFTFHSLFFIYWLVRYHLAEFCAFTNPPHSTPAALSTMTLLLKKQHTLTSLSNQSATEEPNRRRTDVLTMRVLICFEGSCEPFDVPPDLTVGAIKQMVKVIKKATTCFGPGPSLLMDVDSLTSFYSIWKSAWWFDHFTNGKETGWWIYHTFRILFGIWNFKMICHTVCICVKIEMTSYMLDIILNVQKWLQMSDAEHDLSHA